MSAWDFGPDCLCICFCRPHSAGLLTCPRPLCHSLSLYFAQNNEDCYKESCCLCMVDVASQTEEFKMRNRPTFGSKLLAQLWMIVKSIPPLGQAWFCVALFGLAVLLVAFSLNNTVAVKTLGFSCLQWLMVQPNCAFKNRQFFVHN